MRRFGWTLLGAGLLALCSVNMAFATAELELVSGGVTLSLNDNGAVTCVGFCGAFSATDLNPTTGAISVFASNLNGWSVTISTGSSNSPNCSGGNGPGCLDNTTITTQSNGAGTLTVYFADTGFTTEAGFTVSESAASITGTGSTAQTQGFKGTGALPAPGSLSAFSATQIGANLNLGVGLAEGAQTSGSGATGPFDLELVTTFTAGSGGGSFNVDSNIAAVPEPVSMVLAGTLFVLVGVGFRRRKVS